MTPRAIGRGRPLRFLAIVGVGWVAARIALLWPQTGSLPEAIRAAVPSLASFGPRDGDPPSARERAPVGSARPAPWPAVTVSERLRPSPMRVQMALLNLMQFGPLEFTDEALRAPPPDAAPPLAQAQAWVRPLPARWSGSAWIVARPGSGLGSAPGGQLGGSQAGVRLVHSLDPRRRIALFGRFATPLAGSAREAAFGVEWQPTAAPVRLVAEHRIGVDGARGGPGLGVVAGIDEALPGAARIESYGQAGAIARERVEPYADGGARVSLPVAGRGRIRMSLGAGAWGAAQRDAARFDVGPSTMLAVPLGGAQVRVALDWRQRVAGSARPGSGFALTIGSDF